ncbi:Proteasome subunit alpha type-4, partial [Dimargaris xerosporica]
NYTQSGGRRPFGVSTLIIGFDVDGTPKLYQTDPSGIYYAWKANAIGRSSKTVREFLEKNYQADLESEEAAKLVVKALLEVVQTGAKNIEVVAMTADKGAEFLSDNHVESIVNEIEKEKEAEAEKKKKPSQRQA